MVGLDRDRVLELVEQAIAPYVGETLAGASTRAHCDRLGLAGDRLSVEDVRRLLAKLEQGMRVFVGPATAGEIIEGVRATLLPGGA